MKIKLVFRHDPVQRLVRVVRVLWGTEPTTGGNTRALSLAFTLRPSLDFVREHDGWFLRVANIRLHYRRSAFGALV